jgi:hypothetical protein
MAREPGEEIERSPVRLMEKAECRSVLYMKDEQHRK